MRYADDWQQVSLVANFAHHDDSGHLLCSIIIYPRVLFTIYCHGARAANDVDVFILS